MQKRDLINKKGQKSERRNVEQHLQVIQAKFENKTNILSCFNQNAMAHCVDKARWLNGDMHRGLKRRLRGKVKEPGTLEPGTKLLLSQMLQKHISCWKLGLAASLSE